MSERIKEITGKGALFKTKVKFTIIKAGDQYTVGGLTVEREMHDLDDKYVWNADIEQLLINTAMQLQRTTSGTYTATTYKLGDDHLVIVDKVTMDD